MHAPFLFWEMGQIKRTVIMDINIKKISENSQKQAEKLVDASAELRAALAVVRPNSSQESTVDGTLQAFDIIVSALVPKQSSKA